MFRLAFTVPGRPVGWQRPGFCGRPRRIVTKAGKIGFLYGYTKKETREYEAKVAFLFRNAMQLRGVVSGARPPFNVRIGIRTAGGVHPDGDNVIKGIMDAIAHAAGTNDKKWTGSWCWLASGDPRVEIELTPAVTRNNLFPKSRLTKILGAG